jgi:hypothetical protein
MEVLLSLFLLLFNCSGLVKPMSPEKPSAITRWDAAQSIERALIIG